MLDKFYNFNYKHNNMKHLRYSYLTAEYDYNEDRHAQTVMKELGITYQKSVPQTICDQFWFFNCENIPDDLPGYITDLNLTAEQCVGHGLSKEDVIKIDNYNKTLK